MIRPLKILITIFAVIIVVGGIWTLISYRIVSSINIPEYTLVSLNKSFETREYPSYILIETAATGSLDEAVAKGIKVLNDYTSGNNASSTKIQGNFPLRVTKMDGQESTYLVSYILPSSYTRATVPTPLTIHIRVHAVSGHQAAAIPFKGNPSVVQIERQKQNILRQLRVNDVVYLTDAIYIRYTPKTVIPFLQKHEVQVVI